jgi:phosphatidyl-myo-inositol alpha-mannosyltransferase
MKIAILAATLPEPGRKLGGVEVFIHRLANHLAQLPQHQVTVYSLSDRPSDAQYQHQILFPQLAHLRRRKLFIWLIFPALLNFVRWPQPDIIHFFGDDWFYLRRTTATLRTMNGSALNEAKTATTLKRKLAQSLIYPLEHLSVKLATLTVGIGQDSQTIYHLPKIINIGVDQTRFHHSVHRHLARPQTGPIHLQHLHRSNPAPNPPSRTLDGQRPLPRTSPS